MTRTDQPNWRCRLKLHRWLPYLMAMVIMFVLKRHYSTASADQLRWLLQPVGWLVAWCDGASYAWESGIGLVRSDHLITIAPACAGLNFLIMAFGLTVFMTLHSKQPPMRRYTWLIVALGCAFGWTVVVNAARIVVAVALYDAAIEWGWLTPERLHILIGIAVYSGALGLYYTVLHRIMTADGPNSGPLRCLWLPWAWYIVGAVVVPSVHRAWIGQNWPGWEYCLMVGAVSAFLIGSVQLGYKTIARHRSNVEPA